MPAKYTDAQKMQKDADVLAKSTRALLDECHVQCEAIPTTHEPLAKLARDAKADLGKLFVASARFVVQMQVNGVTQLKAILPDYKSVVPIEDDATVTDVDKAMKEIYDNDDRGKVLPWVNAIDTSELAYSRLMKSNAHEKFGLADTWEEQKKTCEFTKEQTTAKQSAIHDGKAVVGIAAYLDWFNQHKDRY